MRFGAVDGLLRGLRGKHLSHRIMAVNEGEPAGIDNQFGLRFRIPDAGLQARRIPGQPHHPVRLMAPQVCLHQRICSEPGLRRRHAGASVYRGRKIQKALRSNARLRFHIGLRQLQDSTITHRPDHRGSPCSPRKTGYACAGCSAFLPRTFV